MGCQRLCGRPSSVSSNVQTASVGVYIKAGSRYEPLPGMSHLLESLAFASTQKRSTLKLQRDVENLGGTVSARTGALLRPAGSDCDPKGLMPRPAVADASC